MLDSWKSPLLSKDSIKSKIFASTAFFTFNVLAVFFFTKYFRHGAGSERENEKEKFWNRRAFETCWSVIKIEQYETALRN